MESHRPSTIGRRLIISILFSLILICLMLPEGHAWDGTEPLIIDHTCTDITKIPESAILAARANLHIAYGHTSFGSHLVNGYSYPGFIELNDFANNGGLGLELQRDIFSFSYEGGDGGLDICHEMYNFEGAMDLGDPDRTAWAEATRDFLDNDRPHNHSHGWNHNWNHQTNVIMWSWCRQVSFATEADIDLYLNLMSQLEEEYPDVMFVYMTGTLDRGTGPQGNLHIRNEQIREYCRNNNKILYDFADIESYDPDGLVNYMELNANDECWYDSDGDGSRESNWAIDWQNTHTEGVDWYNCMAQHSQPLNANQKAYAAWWLWARLAGWDGVSQEVPEEPEYVLGDVNGDGMINVLDILQTARHAAELVQLEGDALWAADVNGDASVNILDIILIARRAVGLINNF